MLASSYVQAQTGAPTGATLTVPRMRCPRGHTTGRQAAPHMSSWVALSGCFVSWRGTLRMHNRELTPNIRDAPASATSADSHFDKRVICRTAYQAIVHRCLHWNWVGRPEKGGPKSGAAAACSAPKHAHLSPHARRGSPRERGTAASQEIKDAGMYRRYAAAAADITRCGLVIARHSGHECSAPQAAP